MKAPLHVRPILFPILLSIHLAVLVAFSGCKDKTHAIETPAGLTGLITTSTTSLKTTTTTTTVAAASQNASPSNTAAHAASAAHAAIDADLAGTPSDFANRYKAALQASDAKALLELGKQIRNAAASASDSSATTPDFATFAALCFTQAARLGNTDAMLLAARCALDGHGMTADRKTAFDLYFAAGEAGETAGYNAAARMLLDGKDAPPDVPGALALINKSLKLGSPEAQFLKGTILLAQGGEASTQAMSLLMEAARADNADAQLLLAKLHREGKYAPLDKEAAAEWSKYAADLGLASANVDYARLTLRGQPGSDEDIRAAIDRLIYAAGQGNASAAMQLAHVFQSTKKPTTEDLATARHYAQLAYENGETDASLMLALLALRTSDPDTALEWLKKEANWTNWRTNYAYKLVTNDGLTLAEAMRTATRAKREDALAYDAERRITADGSTMPIVIAAPQPKIPPSLTSLDATISTKVQFVVDKNGVPISVELLTPTPYDELNQSITDALNQWRFKPATKNGRPVNTRMQLPLTVNTNR
jgi:TonB family protein